MINSMRKLLPIFAILLVGCASVQPYDYTNLQNEAPQSILVIPPTNESVEVNASYTYLSTVSKPLAEKGYYVFPVNVIDTFLKENGLPTPAEMNGIPLDKIREHIGADAVLYVNIKDWGQKFRLLSSVTVVSAEVKLVSAKTGNVLWDAIVHAEHNDNNNSGGGLGGMLVSAIVTQVIGSINDRTPEVARLANNQAFYSKKRGLLEGPLTPKTKKK